jgi:NACalpha-BTF3-like transcription factor
MLTEKKVKKKENEEGLTPKHIQEVVDQIGCSRNQAIRTLRATQDNVAAAISKLTK